MSENKHKIWIRDSQFDSYFCDSCGVQVTKQMLFQHIGPDELCNEALDRIARTILWRECGR